MQRDQALIERWTGAAPFWEKHREAIRQMLEPVTSALIKDAGIARGDTVLDVATGPGEPALGIAAAVGPEGRVAGVDPIPGMIATARRAADRGGFRNAQFEIAFSDDLPFPEDHFDAVVSRFGIMFAPSPIDAVREMLRVLKPGRKLAFAVWHQPENNPFFYALSRVLDRYAPSSPVDPDAPEGFRFAPPGKLRRILDAAGAVETSERAFTCKFEAPVSTEDFWELRVEMSEKLREKVERLSPEQRRLARQQALAAIGEYATPLGVTFPAAVLIVTGKKAG